MTRSERIEAQRRVEIDESLLRGVRAEALRLRSRARMLEGEIAGAKRVIEQKEQQVREAEERMAEIDDALVLVEKHQQALLDDQQAWRLELAG